MTDKQGKQALSDVEGGEIRTYVYMMALGEGDDSLGGGALRSPRPKIDARPTILQLGVRATAVGRHTCSRWLLAARVPLGRGAGAAVPEPP